jgi:glutamate-1-semialdehyde aminotransferase
MANTPSTALPVIARSDALYSRAVGLIPAATQTLAKGAGQYVRGVAPKFAERARGCRIWDVDGNEYVDWTMAVGPVVLGYCHEAVDAAIRAQLELGITFSLPHRLEVEVAERIAELVPNADMVRFSKTGCDVTSAAIRLARAFTGRSRVLCCGYHGWHDWYIAVTDRSQGIPPEVAALTHTFEYNDLDSVRAALDDDTACIILEPTVFEAPQRGFLEGLRELCDQSSALLIFDEMWTGFRVAKGGAQERFGVRADLATFSKAVANGMPLSVLCGRREVMSLLDRDVFFFTTFGGEALSLAAAKATLEVIAQQDVPAILDKKGARLQAGYNAICAQLSIDWTKCVGLGCRTLVTFDASTVEPLLAKTFVQQELVRRGILWTGFHNLSLAHGDEDIERTLNAYGEILPELRVAIARGDLGSRILGDPIEPTFRKVSGFNSKPKRMAK